MALTATGGLMLAAAALDAALAVVVVALAARVN